MNNLRKSFQNCPPTDNNNNNTTTLTSKLENACCIEEALTIISVFFEENRSFNGELPREIFKKIKERDEKTKGFRQLSSSLNINKFETQLAKISNEEAKKQYIETITKSLMPPDVDRLDMGEDRFKAAARYFFPNQDNNLIDAAWDTFSSPNNQNNTNSNPSPNNLPEINFFTNAQGISNATLPDLKTMKISSTSDANWINKAVSECSKGWWDSGKKKKITKWIIDTVINNPTLSPIYKANLCNGFIEAFKNNGGNDFLQDNEDWIAQNIEAPIRNIVWHQLLPYVQMENAISDDPQALKDNEKKYPESSMIVAPDQPLLCIHPQLCGDFSPQKIDYIRTVEASQYEKLDTLRKMWVLEYKAHIEHNPNPSQEAYANLALIENAFNEIYGQGPISIKPPEIESFLTSPEYGTVELKQEGTQYVCEIKNKDGKPVQLNINSDQDFRNAINMNDAIPKLKTILHNRDVSIETKFLCLKLAYEIFCKNTDGTKNNNEVGNFKTVLEAEIKYLLQVKAEQDAIKGKQPTN